MRKRAAGSEGRTSRRWPRLPRGSSTLLRQPRRASVKVRVSMTWCALAPGRRPTLRRQNTSDAVPGGPGVKPLSETADFRGWTPPPNPNRTEPKPDGKQRGMGGKYGLVPGYLLDRTFHRALQKKWGHNLS